MQENINLSEINDVKELKSIMADSFMTRDNANSVAQQSQQNINAVANRIVEIEREAAIADEKEKADNAAKEAAENKTE